MTRSRSPRAAVALLAAAVLALAAGVAAGQSAPSGPQISRSVDGVAGRTVIAWAAPFARYQWDRSRPGDCARGQRGLVFFIPSATAARQTTDCTVPAGQPILVSPLAVICTVPDRGFCTDDARVNDVIRIRLAIDGVPVTVRSFDWVARQAFRVSDGPAAVAGYVYIIGGLAPGVHAIDSSARVSTPAGPIARRMTATVTVQ